MPASAVEQLVAIGSGPLARGDIAAGNPAPPQLASLLSVCDGFYAFESALHVFPSAPAASERSVTQWNAPDLWRHAYPPLDDEWCFFAEDACGGQFAIGPDTVSTFDPETGELDPVAEDIEGWARAVLDDYAVLTGYPLAHDWQVANRALRPGRRLIPRIPFVLGGEFEVGNLYDADSVGAMLYRGDMAVQLIDLPDGATITLRVVD